MSVKTYPIFLASSNELKSEREKFGNFINYENKRLQAKNVFLRLEVWEDMDDSFNTTCKQEDYNEYLAKCAVCVVLFWTKVGKYTLQEYELARKLSLDKKLRLYVYEKKAKPPFEPLLSERESKENFLSILQENGKEQFQGQFENYDELENRFKKTLDGLFDDGILSYGEKAKMLSLNRPIDPNPFFGREEELKIMDERFEKTGQTLLIHAEGGMGKTTLASKYWYNSEYRYSYQCWLFCDLGVMDAVKSLAPMLGLVAKEYSKLDLQEQVSFLKKAILKLEGDFLVVLDNANDAAQIQEFLRYFRGFSWNVLITSRCTEVLESTRDEILLQHLKPEDAKKLFLKYYQEDNEDFERLLERFLEGLNYHTLLIEIFAKNLKESAELGMDLKGFLEELETKGLVLDEDNNFEVKSAWAGNVDKKADTTNDILGVLYDFGQLNEEERLFLVNMSLLPSESYTLPFLLEIFEPDDKRAFRDVLKNLFRKGWIGGSADGNQTQYRLSPVIQNLVQIKNKETLWEDGKAWVKKLTALIDYDGDKDNAHTKFKWIPFVRHLGNIFKGLEEDALLRLLGRLGMLLWKIGGKENLVEAKGQLEKALASEIRNFGEDYPTVAGCRSNLAILLGELGGKENLIDAKIELEKALVSDIRNFGEDSPAVGRYRSNLGLVLKEIGGKENLVDAKYQLEKAFASAILNFGEDSPAVDRYRSNLGLVLRSIGGSENLLEAKGQFEKILATGISNFGEESPVVATRRWNLALVLQDLGGKENLVEAKGQLEKALASSIRIFGTNSPAVAKSRFNLASVLQDLGGKENLVEAKAQLENTINSDIRNFGEDSPNTARSQYSLGTVLADIGDKESLVEAKKLLNDSKIIFLKHFGKGYQMVIDIQSWIDFVREKLHEMENK